jgi:hypothetical protein
MNSLLISVEGDYNKWQDSIGTRNRYLDPYTPVAFMKDELFNELLASVREGGKILRGMVKPSRKFIRPLA